MRHKSDDRTGSKRAVAAQGCGWSNPRSWGRRWPPWCRQRVTALPRGTHTPAGPGPWTLLPDCQRPMIELQPCGPPPTHTGGPAAGSGPTGARRLTSCCEPAVDLRVDFLVSHVASDLLHRLSDDGDSQHEALHRDRERVSPGGSHLPLLGPGTEKARGRLRAAGQDLLIIPRAEAPANPLLWISCTGKILTDTHVSKDVRSHHHHRVPQSEKTQKPQDRPATGEGWVMVTSDVCISLATCRVPFEVLSTPI